MAAALVQRRLEELNGLVAIAPAVT